MAQVIPSHDSNSVGIFLTRLKDYIIPPTVSVAKGGKNLLASIQKVWHACFLPGEHVTPPLAIDSVPYGKALGGLKCVVALNAPVAAYNIYHSWKEFTNQPFSFDQMIDSVLATGGALGDLLDAIATTASGIKDIASLAEPAFAWVTPATGVSIGLSVCHIIVQIKQAWKTQQFFNNFKNDFLDHLKSDNPTKALEYLSSGGYGPTTLGKKEWSKFLVTEGNKAQKIIKNFLQGYAPQKQEKLNDLHNALETRVKRKIFTHKLAIIAAVIAVIAGIILLSVGLPWLVYPLLVLAVVISISKFAYDKWSTKQFEKTLEWLETHTTASLQQCQYPDRFHHSYGFDTECS